MGTRMVHQTDFRSSLGRFALVILNGNLPKQVSQLWNLAQVRICADGGANRLFKEMSPPERFIPDYIIGDLDSIQPEIRAFYASKGTKILDKSHDQDTTDLHKCVAYLRDSIQADDNNNNNNITTTNSQQQLRILVLGGLGGRFDHELGNINVQYSFPSLRICLLNDENLIFLLPKGFWHELLVKPGSHCGLVPVGQPSQSSTTTGLRWNLNSTKMRFGSLISTSNVVENEIVTVESDTDLLWTMEVMV